jgi:hypothetical protein
MTCNFNARKKLIFLNKKQEMILKIKCNRIIIKKEEVRYLYKLKEY